MLLATIVLAALGWEGPEASLTFLKIVGPHLRASHRVRRRPPRGHAHAAGALRPARGPGRGFLARKLRGRAAERVEEARALIEDESHAFHAALSALGGHKRWVLLSGVLLVVLATVTEFVVGLVIMWGFGYRGSVVGPILLQCLLKAILAASPTPGSLAVGEGGYLGFFAVYLPSQVVGLSLVLWRLVVYFVPMLAGGILVVRRLGKRGFPVAADPASRGRAVKDLDRASPRGV